MRFIDCHCHLADNYFYNKIDEFMANWIEKGIMAIGAMATNLKTTRRNLELKERYSDRIFVAAGRHPWGAHKVSNHELEEFEKIIAQPEIAIIGEIGLDHYFVKKKEDYPKQIELLEFFLSLAKKYRKPIMLHQTKAEQEIFDILTTFNLSNAICCHWFSGEKKVLSELADMGCYFSINPAVMKSKRHQKVLSSVKSSQLLTESDGPVKFEDIAGSPLIIPKVCKFISQKLKINSTELAIEIYNNFQRYLSNR
jgi:TatD DNase family protein